MSNSCAYVIYVFYVIYVLGGLPGYFKQCHSCSLFTMMSIFPSTTEVIHLVCTPKGGGVKQKRTQTLAHKGGGALMHPSI